MPVALPPEIAATLPGLDSAIRALETPERDYLRCSQAAFLGMICTEIAGNMPFPKEMRCGMVVYLLSVGEALGFTDKEVLGLGTAYLNALDTAADALSPWEVLH